MDSLGLYFRQQLRGSGVTIIHHRITYLLGKDLWAVQSNCECDIADLIKRGLLPRKLGEVAPILFRATIDGEKEQGIGAAFSLDQLERRLGWLIGKKVTVEIVSSWEGLM